MKIYLNKSSIIKNVLKLHNIFSKTFSVEGKLKSKESNLKNKNYSVFNIFEDEKAEENSINQVSYQNKFYDDIALEETEKINEIPEKNKDFHEVPKEQVEQPLINLEKSKLKENTQYNSNSMKPNYTKPYIKQNVDHEQLIDRMLLQKTNSYQQNYNYNNSNNGSNHSNKHQNYNNNYSSSSNDEYNSNTQKRQRISFLREGMVLNLYLKKVFSVYLLSLQIQR